mmetsp:Transcript_6592/g.21229  ORF Transcript_6592/g.21229 Transcript_6592/m.21229 type:complete len:175 (+) Transcript_6592:75-599(+)
MGVEKLPARVVSETLHSGCSKRRSHRMLPRFQQLELKYDFPKFPQIMGEWIVRRISKKETGKETDHPCSKAFDSFLCCCRRHPNSYEKKCRVEAGKYYACLSENKGWKAPEGYQYMRYLEHFRVFSEGAQSRDMGPGKFNYKEKTPGTHGVGSVLEFSRAAPRKPGGRGQEGPL